ncbi:MAG: hypothetical protein E5V24_20590 [Mesorhizobium sp.]|nr:MAG: hypothetical protein E5V24_20590 [Mesorhizobium sp.]
MFRSALALFLLVIPAAAHATEAGWALLRDGGHVVLLRKTDASEKAAQLEAVLTEIRGYSGSDNLVMVTHLENIMALTGISPREGEAVIVELQGDGLRVLGRVTF